jgi:hypothetical protein
MSSEGSDISTQQSNQEFDIIRKEQDKKKKKKRARKARPT